MFHVEQPKAVDIIRNVPRGTPSRIFRLNHTSTIASIAMCSTWNDTNPVLAVFLTAGTIHGAVSYNQWINSVRIRE